MRTLLLLLVLTTQLAAADAPWFTEIAADVGLANVRAKRTKLIDLTGDGWPDALLMSQDGAPWLRAVRRAHGVPADRPIATPIPRADWKGGVPFATVDTGKDGAIDAAELAREARKHLWSLFRSEPDGKGGRRFVDMTRDSGLRCGRPYHLAIAGDVDNDGDLDLLCTGYATQNPGKTIETPAFVLLNDGRGRFTPFDQARPARPGDPAGPNVHAETVCGASFVDVDRDGRLDLFLGSWYRYWGGDLKLYAAYPDRLYRGLGRGRFADITTPAGLMLKAGLLDTLPEADRKAGRVRPETRARVGRGCHRPTYGVAAADWDNDGDPDLFTLSYGRQWNHHWRNDGKRFVEIGEQSRFDGDEDESGTYPKAFHPRGRRAELPFRSNGNSFDVSFGDYDNDGDLDCVVSDYTHAWAGSSSDITCILTNTGKAGGWRFERRVAIPRKRSVRNWNQGDICTAFADIDNDGWLDLLVSSCAYPDHNVLELYRQIPGESTFVRVTDKVGLRWPDSAQISLADVDRDGDLDILAGNLPHASRRATLPERVALWRNDIANRSGNRFLTIALEGGGDGKANRMAVGARVLVTAGGVTRLREVSAGRGHVGHQDDHRLHFGLGKAAIVDAIEVRWNDAAGSVDRYTRVRVDQHLRIRQGAKTPTPLTD